CSSRGRRWRCSARCRRSARWRSEPHPACPWAAWASGSWGACRGAGRSASALTSYQWPWARCT
ncbi:hypothetical protein PMAYCL1PPCAC_28070, partial [Pristionchus mayeri]